MQQLETGEGRIASINIANVSDASLQSLRLGNMINDQIVDGYLELIQKSGAIISTTRLLENCTTKTHPYDQRMSQIEYLPTQASKLYLSLITTMSEDYQSNIYENLYPHRAIRLENTHNGQLLGFKF